MAKALELLMVADSDDQASRYTEALRRGGYEPAVRRVRSVPAVVEALGEQAHWDVIVADAAAQDIDGLKALTRLAGRNPGVPLVLVADNATSGNAGTCARCVTPADLAAAVDRAVGEITIDLESDTFLLRALMAGTTDRIYFKDLRGRFLMISQAVADMFDLGDPSDAVGKTDFDFFTDEHAEQAFADEQQVIATGLPVVAKDEKETWPDGHETWVSTTKLPLLDADGHVIGTFGISRDITEQVLARQEQQHLEAQLTQAQKMEATGRLAGGMAHAFRNQLTVIRGYCDILLRQLAQDDPSRLSIEEIRAAAERSAGVTGQLLAFSRRQAVSPQVLDVSNVLREMEGSLAQMLGEDITVSMVLSHGRACILADPAQVQQALINMAVNARDAMPGGGHLTIETATTDLDDDYVRRHVGAKGGPHLMITVSDTGTGMDQATCEQIFEPFFTTKDKGKGTGLGLSMVYGFVKQTGGTVTVYSEVGHGSTFTIYLPLTAAPGEGSAEPAGPEPAARSEARGTETILVAEDEDAVRELIARVLRRSGYTVLEAGNAREAMPLGEHYDGAVDLLITDVVMPGMSGPELAQCLQPIRPNMPVLFLSGYTAEAMAPHGMLNGQAELLTKPFAPVALTRTVRRILDERKERTDDAIR